MKVRMLIVLGIVVAFAAVGAGWKWSAVKHKTHHLAGWSWDGAAIDSSNV